MEAGVENPGLVVHTTLSAALDEVIPIGAVNPDRLFDGEFSADDVLVEKIRRAQDAASEQRAQLQSSFDATLAFNLNVQESLLTLQEMLQERLLCDKGKEADTHCIQGVVDDTHCIQGVDDLETARSSQVACQDVLFSNGSTARKTRSVLEDPYCPNADADTAPQKNRANAEEALAQPRASRVTSLPSRLLSRDLRQRQGLVAEWGASEHIWSRMFSQSFEYWESLEEPTHTGRLAKVVLHPGFDTVCLSVILLNSIFAIFDTDWKVSHYYSVKRPPFLFTAEMAFVAWYTLELFLKILVHRQYFFINKDMRWNWFDSLIVVVSLSEALPSLIASQGTGNVGNVTFARVLRVLKMVRILRMVRLMRFFSETRILLNSIVASFDKLFWSIMMLLFILYIFSLVLVQGAALWMEEINHKHVGENGELHEDFKELRERVVECFGSVMTAMTTLFQTCTGGDDWSGFYKVAQITGDQNAVIFVCFVAFSQIALLNILTGIFVEGAMKAAQPEREIQAWEVHKTEKETEAELRRLCEAVAKGSNGILNREDFTNELMNGRLKAYFSLLGLDVKDAQKFFSMLEILSDGQVDVDAFVYGCLRMKGTATCLDMQYLLFETKTIRRHQRALETRLDRSLREFTAELEKAVACSAVDQRAAFHATPSIPRDTASNASQQLHTPLDQRLSL